MLKYLVTIVVGLLSLAWSASANAHCISGTVKTNTSWSQPSSSWNGFSPGSGKTLFSVKVSAVKNGGGFLGTVSSASGAYNICGAPTGTYTVKVIWHDPDGRWEQTDPGTGLLKASNMTTNLSVSGNTTFNHTFTGGTSHLPSTHLMAYYWFTKLAQGFNGFSMNDSWHNMGTIKIAHISGGASAGAYNISINTTLQTNWTLWHEMGHSLERQATLYGSGGSMQEVSSWDNPVCNAHGGAVQQTGVRAFREGWADFIADVMMKGGNFANCEGIMDTGQCLAQCTTWGASTSGPVPAACGSNTAPRHRQTVARALCDLVDGTASAGGGCVADNIAVHPYNLLAALENWPDGQGEGQLEEADTVSNGVGNSNRREDGAGIVDMLYYVKQLTGKSTYNTWANSCFSGGDAPGSL